MSVLEIVLLAIALFGVIAYMLALTAAEDLTTVGAEWFAQRLGRAALRFATFGQVRDLHGWEWVIGLALIVAFLLAALVFGARAWNSIP